METLMVSGNPVEIVVTKFKNHPNILPAGIYLFKINSSNFKEKCEVGLKLSI